MHKTWQAVIIGAGPAGISCAIWLKQLGFDPLLIEASDRVGGLCSRNPFPDLWTPTQAGRTGIEVAQDMASQLAASQVHVWLNTTVQTVRCIHANAQFELTVLRDSKPLTLDAATVVIASGVKPRPLNVGQDQAWPGVLIGPGQHVVDQHYDGLRVALLGGGDNAFENYEYVKSRGAKQAHIYARSVRAQKQFVSRVNTIDVHFGPYVVEPATRTVNGHHYDLILVLYGWQPQAGFAAELNLKHDPNGFIATDARTAQTSLTGVYAIGEVAQRMHPCVVTAFADGVVAAKAIEAQFNAPHERAR